MDKEYIESVTQKIVSQLEEVYDPEIPINIYDLGLIYKIEIKSENSCYILMTLTSPTCPTAEYIQAMVEEAALSVDEIQECDVELTFEPRWTPDLVSTEVKEEMGFFAETKPDETPQHIKDEIKKQENLQVQETFSAVSSNPQAQEIRVCFNCAVTEKVRPLLMGYFNNEQVYICTKCIGKFN